MPRARAITRASAKDMDRVMTIARAREVDSAKARAREWIGLGNG